jgi:hypothetical protein
MTSNKIEAVIQSLPIKKSPALDGFTAEFYQTLKKELTSMLLKLFHEMERKGTLPNSFYGASTTLIPKSDRAQHKNCTPISLINRDAVTRKCLQTEFNNILKRSYTMIKSVSLQ